MSGFDFYDLMKRIIKYLVEGLVVAICAIILPKKALLLEEVVILGLTAACTFSLLDVFSPQIAAGSRTGVGAGIGFNMVGFPGGLKI